MLAAQFLDPHLPYLEPSQTVAEALRAFDHACCAHLPLVDEGIYLGLVAKDELKEAGNYSRSLEKVLPKALERYCLLGDRPLHEALRLLSEFEISALPVVDARNNYIGVISPATAVDALAQMTGSNEPGGIIVLEIAPLQYSLREIASIVESNDTYILGVLAQRSEDGNLLVTLKLNRSELTGILSSFERFKYRVAATFFDQKQLNDTEDRYNALMRYLSI